MYLNRRERERERERRAKIGFEHIKSVHTTYTPKKMRNTNLPKQDVQFSAGQ